MASIAVTKEEWDAIPWKWIVSYVYSSELQSVTNELQTMANRMVPLFKFHVINVFYDPTNDRYTGVYTYRQKVQS